MSILQTTARRVKPARRNRFGAGILPTYPTYRVDFSAADAAWLAVRWRTAPSRTRNSSPPSTGPRGPIHIGMSQPMQTGSGTRPTARSTCSARSAISPTSDSCRSPAGRPTPSRSSSAAPSRPSGPGRPPSARGVTTANASAHTVTTTVPSPPTATENEPRGRGRPARCPPGSRLSQRHEESGRAGVKTRPAHAEHPHVSEQGRSRP